MSDDLIKRSDAIDAVIKAEVRASIYYKPNWDMVKKFIADIPSADTFEITKEALIEAIDNAETVGDIVENIINRPRGTYTNSEENVEWYAIEATCNLCGKPWMGARNFCPNCGIRMKGADDETNY